MAPSCKKCEAEITGIERIACRCCKSDFHRSCISGLNRPTFDAIVKNTSNLFWLCDNCNGRFDNLLQAMETDEVTAPAVVDEREQFWMYLGRLHHSHSVDDIAEMTQECLGLQVAPKVIRLVKKDVDVTKLPFVSFRVLLPDETRDVALQAETWSTGVAIREFDFDKPLPADVIALTETWLSDDIVDAELSPNYTIFRQDRSARTSDRRRGGGVLIAVRNSPVHACTRVVSEGYEHLEQVAVRVKVHNHHILVCCIYIRPNSDPDIYVSHGAAVQELLDLSTHDDSVIVTGDYNLPHLSWYFDDDLNCLIPLNASSEQELALTENVISTGLQQVCSLTNINGRTLDLAFVNDVNSVELIEPPTPILKTDRHHKAFVLKAVFYAGASESSPLPGFEPDFSNSDYVRVSEALNSVNWDTLLRDQDTNGSTATFYDVVYNLIQQFVPMRRISCTRTGKLPWWTADLRHSRNILRKARKSTALQDLRYREYLSRVEADVEDNPSSFWSYIKGRKRSSVHPTKISHNGRSADNPVDAANFFADFFSSVYDTVTPTASATYLDTLRMFDIDLPRPDFTQAEVEMALNAIDPAKGAGPDRLPPAFIKELSSSFARPISTIFNRSLSEGVFPDEWKLAALTPIHKSGSTLNAENYRPISILSCLPKVFEVLIHKGMYSAAQEIVSTFQHGFVKKRSTVTNLMAYVSALNANLEKRKQTDTIYFDFSKAFDTVPQSSCVSCNKT
ncbi:hypothetical protein pipiens_016403 [Culex pipiens pipiens]|uniref:Reverse transcriptase n=1 Tax=Culex pipiens pipiens TaxID=38569 RepID=A0ABD1CMD6_CULPP